MYGSGGGCTSSTPSYARFRKVSAPAAPYRKIRQVKYYFISQTFDFRYLKCTFKLSLVNLLHSHKIQIVILYGKTGFKRRFVTLILK